MKRKTRLLSARDFVALVRCSAGLPTADLLRGMDCVLGLVLPQRSPLRRELLLALSRVLDGRTTITVEEQLDMMAAWMNLIVWIRPVSGEVQERLRAHLGNMSMAFACFDRYHVAELLSALATELFKIGSILNVSADQFSLAWRCGAQKNWSTNYASDHPSA